MATTKIILVGGSGLLGTLLARDLVGGGYEVVILSRRPGPRPHAGARVAVWNANRVERSWSAELESAAAVINLCGRSVNCRYTAKNRREILESRIVPTRTLGAAIAQCREPPAAWLNGSTATIYKDSRTPMDEANGVIGATPEAHDAFSIEVARAWEQALADAVTPRTRKLALRTAMVLAPRGNSVFPILRRLTRWGLGGRMGPGTQMVSWIHGVDFCRCVRFLLEHGELAGAFNMAAPEPVTNAEFMRAFREALHRRVGMATPSALLKMGAFVLRTEPELVLKSRCVVPGRLVAAGFGFVFPTVGEALVDLVGRGVR